MTQLSINPVHKDVYYSIRDDFLWILGEIQSPGAVKSFFYDFFTKTERVMLSKRFAIACMLQKGFNYEEIRFVLHVSTSTINRVANKLDHSESTLVHAIDALSKKERMDQFWVQVESILKKFRVYHK